MYEIDIPLRGAWIEVDLKALAKNMHLVRSMIGEQPLVMPVVKADAYGHGAPRCAEVLLQNGANRFAVASLQEGIRLREAGIYAPILCLGYLPPRQYEAAINYGITIAVYTEEQGIALSKAACRCEKTATVHIKVDTGFSRLGFLVCETSAKSVARIAALPNLDIEGVFSHFAAADEQDKRFCRQQAEAFQRFIELCRKEGVGFRLRHIANSAAIIDMPEYVYDMCRPGIILYGYQPSPQVSCPGLQPVMSIKAEVARIFPLKEGGNVGYGRTWTAQRDSMIATIPLGYADGISRLQQNGGYVLLHGMTAPIVGRICMDYFMVDVTDVNARRQVQAGDSVTIIGNDGDLCITAEDLAERMGTISYEIMCMLGNRLPKVYK